MAIQTRNVTVNIFDNDGAPLEKARVVIALVGLGNEPGGAVAPGNQEKYTNASGQVLFELWENNGAYSNTHYEVQSWHPLKNTSIHRRNKFRVPGHDAELEDLISLDLASFDPSQQLRDEIVAAMGATLSAASATEINKNSASSSAQTASIKAQEANEYSSSAGESSAEAEAASEKSELWANADEDVQVEPGKYSAKHWALKIGSRLNNLTATSNPSPNDDQNDGYQSLSHWINTLTNEVYICLSAAPGAAIWIQGTLTVDELGNLAMLNASVIGRNLVQVPNPSAIRFLRINTDGSVSLLDGTTFLSAISGGKKISVVNVSTATHNIEAVNESAYLRFAFSGPKSVTIRPNSVHAIPAAGSWVIRNASTGSLTIIAGAGVTINPTFGGSLVLEPGMTVTMQNVGIDDYDLIGQTVPT